MDQRILKTVYLVLNTEALLIIVQALRGAAPFQAAVRSAGAVPAPGSGAAVITAPFIVACLTALRLLCTNNRPAVSQAKACVKEALCADITSASKDGHAMNFAYGIVTEAVLLVGAVPLDADLVQAG